MTIKQISRDNILDLARLLACLSVMLFHFFSRHLDGITQYPYGDAYNYFSYGYLGVQFFFILSGYLFIPSISKASSFIDFFKKKIIRLWIPLLICSIVTYVAVLILDTDHIYADSHKFSNFLFSLTFVHPFWGSLLLKTPLNFINGSYWFLGVEVLFLLLCSIVYFIDRKHGLRNIVIISLLFHVFYICLFYCGHRIIVNYFCNNILNISFSQETMYLLRDCLNNWVYPCYSIYCVFGIILYHVSIEGITKKNMLAVVTIISIWLVCNKLTFLDVHETILIATIALCWGIYVRCVRLRELVSYKFVNRLARLGSGTYSAYLIHETIGVVLIHNYTCMFDNVSWVLPILIIILSLTYGYFSCFYIEQPITKFLIHKP